jgi:hypothetical protein
MHRPLTIIVQIACRFQNQLSASKQSSGAARGVYVFSEMNPYVGHPNPMQEGQELFRKGLLSEAALALEAEVLKNPDNAEGWRLLGVTHAENDDDQQVIVPRSLMFDVVTFSDIHMPGIRVHVWHYRRTD